MKKERAERTIQLAKELADLVASLTDEEFEAAWESGVAHEFLAAIQDPTERSKYEKTGDYLLARKSRLTFLARLRRALQESYPVRTTHGGETCMISVMEYQWFDDAVMFVEGTKPFEGRIGKYDGSEVSYAVSARHVAAGENMGPDDFEFIPLEQARAAIEKLAERPLGELRAPIQRLDELLAAREKSEAEYQVLLHEYPWSLGLRWRMVERHEQLDGHNIPDLTGLRVDRDVHDIIEIKPPFASIFKQSGELAASFNDAWNQCERYLDFVDRESGYLRRERGLNFENARCFLVVGYDLSPEKLARIRRKERMNPRIEIRTYDDLRRWITATVEFIEEQRSD